MSLTITLRGQDHDLDWLEPSLVLDQEDEAALERALLEQPQLVARVVSLRAATRAWVADEEAELAHVEDAAFSRIKAQQTQLDEQRRGAGAYAMKITDPGIWCEVGLDSLVRDQRETVRRAKKALEQLEAAMIALDHRGDALCALVGHRSRRQRADLCAVERALAQHRELPQDGVRPLQEPTT